MIDGKRHFCLCADALKPRCAQRCHQMSPPAKPWPGSPRPKKINLHSDGQGGMTDQDLVGCRLAQRSAGDCLMTDATRFQFTNPSVPKAYDEFLVPRLFEPWANLLLDKADLRPGESVLDIATGPGTVARLAAVRVGAKGRVVATDIAPPMLDIAKAKGQPSAAAPIPYLSSPA